MDHATFDRLTRLLAGGASRRHTLRAIIAAALAGGTAKELLAARKRKDKAKARNEKKDGDSNRDDRDRDEKRSSGDGKADRVAAQGKNKNNKNKKKRKRKKKRNNTGGNTGGNRCAGTPLRPGQNFLGCDFSGDNLRGKDLHSATFKDVDLSDANLCGANLESTSFADSDLSDANLSFVNLDSSSYSKTSFAGADLTGATFRVATFSKVNFTGANLTGADLTGATVADTDFSGATFCRTVQPDGRLDNRDCDICENICGVCKDCDDEECAPPDCCPNPEGPGGVCVDTDTDPLNCGGCDAACLPNLSNACVDGECVCGNEPECSGGDTCCRGEGGGATRCIDTDTDPLHCGACNAACLIPLNPCLSVECQDGQCVEVGAADGTPCELEGDPGVCCAAGSSVTCVVGTECCSNAQCDSGEACCEGQCIDVEDDPNNCGGCDVICLTPTNPCLTNECIEGGCVDGTLSDGTECEAFEQTGVCCGGGGTSTCVFGAECCTNAQCGTGQSCCEGQCVNTTTNFDRCGSCTNICPEGRATACVGGACVCGANPVCAQNEFCCPDGCFDLDTSFTHCGTCTFACPTTRADNCTDGQCHCGAGPLCAEGETCCNSQCVNTSSDTDNCGECGRICDPPLNSCNTVLCLEGTCNNFADPDGTDCAESQGEGICCFDGSAAICLAGAQCCSDDGCDVTEACCDNQCIDPNTDFDHCGICTNACVQGKADACSNGQCVCGSEFECSESETCCNSQCVDTETDFANCGGCGDTCLANADTCADSECVCGELDFSCPEGNLCCGGACIDSGDDRQNCGGCGEICGTDETCESGECTPCAGVVCADTCIPGGACCTVDQCLAGECRTAIACDTNQCVYENLPDETACINGGVCVAGQCRCGAGPACESGSTCCTNQCIDTSSDRFNCGICGFECVDGICSGGECVACEGIPCGDQCLEPPACCTVDDCLGQTCKVKTGCSAEHECLYDNAPAGTPCGFGECDSEGNCIGG